MHLDKLFITVPPAKKKGYGSRVGVKKGLELLLELLLEQLKEVQTFNWKLRSPTQRVHINIQHPITNRPASCFAVLSFPTPCTSFFVHFPSPPPHLMNSLVLPKNLE